MRASRGPTPSALLNRETIGAFYTTFLKSEIYLLYCNKVPTIIQSP